MGVRNRGRTEPQQLYAGVNGGPRCPMPFPACYFHTPSCSRRPALPLLEVQRLVLGPSCHQEEVLPLLWGALFPLCSSPAPTPPTYAHCPDGQGPHAVRPLCWDAQANLSHTETLLRGDYPVPQALTWPSAPSQQAGRLVRKNAWRPEMRKLSWGERERESAPASGPLPLPQPQTPGRCCFWPLLSNPSHPTPQPSTAGPLKSQLGLGCGAARPCPPGT